MTRFVAAVALIMFAASSCLAAPPVVSNVTASQRTDGSKKVDIYYDLADPDTANLSVSVKASNDGGATYTITPSSVSGDVGAEVSRGTGRHIVWNAGTDLPGAYGTNYRLCVTAADTERVATPVFNPDGGTYDGPILVTVSCTTAGATIHWTTNGADPGEADPVVASGGQVTVSHSLTLKAKAWKTRRDPSELMSAPYTITGFIYPGEMIYIPPGSFLMGNSGVGDDAFSCWGNEFPQHSVHLSGYYIGKYEVTRGEYRQFMNAGGYSNPAYWSAAGWNWHYNWDQQGHIRTEPTYWAAVQDWGTGEFAQTDNHPVTGVSNYEIEAFCNWAGGHPPTEAQWEKAARWDGHPRVYPWGDVWDPEKCNNVYDHNPAGGGYERRQTAPVGSYPSGASPYGCQDMAGNVWESCSDWYDYYPETPAGGWSDPQGPTYGNYRVLRGTTWDYYQIIARCAFRGNSIYGCCWGPGGFRLAR